MGRLNASNTPEGEPGQGAGKQAAPPPPPLDYDEVTIADLLDVLIRRRRLVVGTFTIVFLGTILFTALTPPTYEATASIIAINERNTIVTILQSEQFAKDVARDLTANPSENLNTAAILTANLRDHVRVENGGRSSNQDVVVITATGNDPTTARLIAEGYVTTLAKWRPHLENVTHGKNWQKYYEQAGKDEEKAKAEMAGLLQNYTYYEFLDLPEAPASPTKPVWNLNLALGVILGFMLAILVPFGREGVSNALAEVRGRWSPPWR